MLIRNAMLDGYAGPVDLRLMHGAVQEIGVGLQKGMYEAEIDLAGDELLPWPPEMALPRKYARRGREAAERIVAGAQEPFVRKRETEIIGIVDQHSGD